MLSLMFYSVAAMYLGDFILIYPFVSKDSYFLNSDNLQQFVYFFKQSSSLLLPFSSGTEHWENAGASNCTTYPAATAIFQKYEFYYVDHICNSLCWAFS